MAAPDHPTADLLARALRMAGVGYWSWDFTNDTLTWSDETFRILGQTARDGVIPIQEFTEIVHPEDRARVATAMRRLRDTGETPDLEYRAIRPDGRIILVLVHASLQHDGWAFGTLQDVTDTRRQQREAERANRVKTDFLSRISRELRTPLNVVLGFSQLLVLDEDELQPRQQEHAREIHEGGMQLLALVKNLLDLSDLEAGTASFHMEPVDLVDAVPDAVRAVAPMAERRCLDISTAIGEEPVMVYADRGRLRQVLVNLLSNAVRFNRHGGLVDIAVIRADGVGRVTIADTGTGIPESQQPYLFHAFEGAMPDPYQAEGPGIGLTICRHIVERFDGTINFETSEGKGTVFRLELSLL